MQRIGEKAEESCHGCGKWQPIEEFSFKDKARNKLRSRCRACCREVSRRHYQRHRAAYIERRRRRQPLERRRTAGAVLAYLRDHPCTGCGESDPVVLEFNHVDSTSKLGNIGQMIRDCVSKAPLATDIAKCEVLCANCHQRHTISSKLAHYKLGALRHGPTWRVAANRRNAAFVLEWLAVREVSTAVSRTLLYCSSIIEQARPSSRTSAGLCQVGAGSVC